MPLGNDDFRERRLMKEALQQTEFCANTQFDPHLVETFAQVVNSSVVSMV